MFGKARHYEGQASEALHELRDLTAERAKELGHTARNRLSDVGDEARHRASTAWDVLAGRPMRASRWPMVRAGLIGIALGWAAAELYRRRRDEVNEAVSRLGSELREAKTNIDERVAKAKATPGSPIEKAKAAVVTNNSAATKS